MSIGWIITLFIIYMIIEVLLIVFLVGKILKFHTLTIKDTIVYPILLILTTIIVLTGLSLYSKDSMGKNILTAIMDSVNIAKLSVDNKFIEELNKLNISGALIKIAYYSSYFISLLALISLSISVAKASFKNFWKIFKRNFMDEITFVLGMNEDAKKFIKSLEYEKRKNVIFVLDTSKLEKYADEKFFLEKYKITYLKAPYSNEKEMNSSINNLIYPWKNPFQIIRYIRTKNNKISYNFITFFDDDAKNISFANSSKRFIVEKNCYGGFYFKSVETEKNDSYRIRIGDYFCIEIFEEEHKNNELFDLIKAGDKEPLAYKIYWDKDAKRYICRYLFKAEKNIKICLDERKISEDDAKSFYSDKDILNSFKKDNKINEYLNISKAELEKINFNDIKLLKFKKPKNVTFNITCDSLQQSLLDKIICSNDINEILNDRNIKINAPLYYGKEGLIIGEIINSTLQTKTVQDYSFGLIRTFNKYEIISLDFIKKYSLASFIDEDNIDDCTIKDCDINLYVLGYGKVNQVLLRDILICNSFIQKCGTSNSFKLKSKRINVKIYDKSKRVENIALSNGFIKYNKRELNAKKYYPLPENYINYPEDFKFDKEISDYNLIKEIYDDINMKIPKENTKSKINKQYNFFLISLDTDSKNWSIASLLQEDLNNISKDYCKNVFFVRTSNNEYMYGNRGYFKNRNIYGFGVECVDKGDPKSNNKLDEIKSSLSYDNIIKQELINSAKIANINYESDIYNDDIEKCFIDSSFAVLNKFKQKSNIYTILGLYSKFNLIFSSEKSRGVIELSEDYYQNKEEISSNRFVNANNYRRSDILAFIEKERWNAFEIGFGVMPYKKEEAKQNRTSQIDSIYHICITTCEGLDEIYKDWKTNYVKYDYDIINHYQKNPTALQKFLKDNKFKY